MKHTIENILNKVLIFQLYCGEQNKQKRKGCQEMSSILGSTLCGEGNNRGSIGRVAPHRVVWTCLYTGGNGKSGVTVNAGLCGIKFFLPDDGIPGLLWWEKGAGRTDGLGGLR